ncbi:MAG: MarC family protein [Alphaproteobacteria bacterium]|nr:MarC family protein [Alphaproteobacteria bacterium]
MFFPTFLHAMISLLVIANPLGVSSVFVGLMAQSEPNEMKTTAVKAVVVACGVLLFFGFCGEWLLTSLGIRLPSFHVAGGLLLFVIAFKMLFGDARYGGNESDHGSVVDRSDVAVFPLAIPLIAGPGCMTVMILLMSSAQSFQEKAGVLAALGVVMVITLLCLLGARGLLRLVGASGNLIIARVMGMILAARSVQFIVDGIRGIKTLFFS